MKSIKSRLATKVLGAGGAVALAVLLVQCNSSPSVTIANGNVSGLVVVTGPVSGASLSVFRFNGADRAALVGTGSTAADGTYSIDVHTSGGPFLVVATGGSFTDVASRNSVRLNGNELTALVPVFNINDKRKVTVSPISHLAATLALAWVRAGQTMDDAGPKAVAHINTHFGGIDWTSVVPTDLTVSTSAQLDDGAKAGVILAGLSMEAKIISDTNNAGGAVDALTLTETLALDLAGDALFNGQGAQGQLTQPPTGSSVYKLDGQTVRSTLSQGITRFLQSSRNVSGITAAAAQGLIQGIGIDADALLFTGSSGGVDTTPPVISFVSPIAGTTVTGQFTVEAVATDDDGSVGAFSFTAPAQLTSAKATAENPHTSRLKAVLSAGAFSGNSLTITAVATDVAGNRATQDLTVTLSNFAPTVALTVTPLNGNGELVGTVTVTAKAASTNGSNITSIVPLNAPKGMVQPYSNPQPDTVSYTWDTTQVDDGPQTLSFHIEDSVGGKFDLGKPVTVNNWAFGVVNVVVSAGNPVVGATITVNAINDTTGLLDPVRGTLGQCSGTSGTGTDASGTLSCTLTAKNWNGPIQIIAEGTSASFIDPTSNVATKVPLNSFKMSTYIAAYSTNSATNQIKVPVTLWTTLAAAAADAYAQGRHRKYPVAHSLASALSFADPLFSQHVFKNPTWPLRTTVPASLITSGVSLGNLLYAALVDVGLNQLAADMSQLAGSPGLVTAVDVARLLQDDVSFDGQFDGNGAAGQLMTNGSNPQKVNTDWLRYLLARALDKWFQSSNNKSGISTTQLQHGVYDQMSADTTDIFGSALPTPYDSTPPRISITAVFHDSLDGGIHDPVPNPDAGTPPVVAGKVDLKATAIDDESPITALSLWQGPTELVRYSGPFTQTQASVQATFDTIAAHSQEAAILFTATAKDGFDNSDAGTATFTVDNTPPALQFKTDPQYCFPDGGYVKDTVAIDVTATDMNGTQPPTVSGLDGGFPAAVGNRLYGTYNVSGLNEGPVTLQFNDCDLVYNCATVPRTFIVDHTPPMIAASNPLPPSGSDPNIYTSSPTIEISVTASDPAAGSAPGSGVAEVDAQGSASSTVVQALTPTGSVYKLPVSLGPGNNSIRIWGKDRVDNSGQSSPIPGTSLSLSVYYATTPPTAAAAPLASYFDETNLQLVPPSGGADPKLVSSWAYSTAGMQKTAVDPTNNTVVRKATTRLSWFGAPPSMADLLGTNSTNTPLIAYIVNTVDAPIRTVKFSNATVTCSGCPGGSASGNLIQDTGYPGAKGQTRWLLPITSSVIPSLAQVVGSAQVVFQIDVVDAAGLGKSLTGQQFQLQIVAPPVSCLEDTGFLAGTDPRRASAFQIFNNTYTGLFQNNSYPSEAVRFARYVCHNPAAAPLALAPQLTGEGSHANPVVDRWEATSDYAPNQPSSAGNCYDSPSGVCNYSANPCSAQGGGPVTYLKAGGTACGVAPSTTLAPETQQDTWALSTAAYQVGSSIEQPATLANNGAILVPAASNGVTGQVALYLIVPNHSVPASLIWDPTAAHYQTSYATYDGGGSTRTSCTCVDPSNLTTCPTTRSETCYSSLLPWFKYLSAADSKLFGTLAVTTTSLNGTSVTGSSSTTSQIFSRSISH